MGDEEEILKDPLEELDLEEETIQTPEPEKDKDNSEPDKKTQEGTEEPEKVKPEVTAKEKRHAEQLAGSKQEADRLRGLLIDAEVAKAKIDGTNLLELAGKDPKLADEVAKKFGYSNFNDAKKVIVGDEAMTDKVQTKPTEEQFEEWYQQRKAKEEHELAVDDAKAIIDKLPEDVQEEAIETFNELVGDKMLTREKAKKFAEMVTLSLQKEQPKKIDETKALKKLSSTGINNTKKINKEDKQLVIFDGQEILLDSNQLS